MIPSRKIADEKEYDSGDAHSPADVNDNDDPDYGLGAVTSSKGAK
ncbi:MAG: hypothetical protein FalmKO_32200 [Falsiruegeria mediterranea]